MTYVLVVEDDPDIREVVADALRGEGHAVRVATDGLDALEQLQQIASGGGRAFLVLLDLMMPRMNGWELHRRLRADPAFADVPICTMSAFEAGADLDAQRSLRKPFALDDLLAIVAGFARPNEPPSTCA